MAKDTTWSPFGSFDDPPTVMRKVALLESQGERVRVVKDGAKFRVDVYEGSGGKAEWNVKVQSPTTKKWRLVNDNLIDKDTADYEVRALKAQGKIAKAVKA